MDYQAGVEPLTEAELLTTVGGANLTHPGDPNYYPVIGGSDFGTNWNCHGNCFNYPQHLD
jgi:hypothetical protein